MGHFIMKFTCAFVVVTASLASIGFASAQSPDYPSTGIVYNTIEAASLTHYCKLTSDKFSMDCEFTQTSVRRKLNADDAIKKLADAKAEFISKPMQMSQKECAEYETLSMILQGKKAAPDPQGMSKMSEREKADVLAISSQMVSFCRAPNIDSWMKIVSTGIEKDKRTCLVSSYTFKQKFRRSDTNAWIVISQADGPCGVVQLSRFEPDKTKYSTFWNYFSRKAVTNPNAEAGLISCNMLDEREYKYQWQQRNPDLNCEYVEFSPI
ncbi:hypothetical protein V1278_003791 [Bradyrhizobium sp. AZCC 1577]|uniref:hypothetical protein n=1 Tax=Bradyrhizobium sp. AZCC 1577 TaxID=3117019 RepID=UPI002FF080D7